MKVGKLDIPVRLKDGKIISLRISGSTPDSLFLLKENEMEECESPYQLVEGRNYFFQIDDGYSLAGEYGIITTNTFQPSVGTISPNIYVGTLSLDITSMNRTEPCGNVRLEVQSQKMNYRNDYRKMLTDITNQCIELIFQYSSPVTQPVVTNYEKDFKTLHQRFAFIKSIIDTDEFLDAANKIISSPVTKWKESESDKDIRGVRRMKSSSLRQIANSKNRIKLPEGHPLLSERLRSIPSRMTVIDKTEAFDTPENRFIKHALQTFLFFVSDFKSRIKDESKIKLEAEKLESRLDLLLSHSFFKSISNPDTILLNNPVLQRKEGYREILRVWLMFNLAAELSWKGGDDVYDIEKRNVAVLYEYWVFFELLKIMETVFGIKPGKSIIVDSNDKLGLQLKQGIHFPVKGSCEKFNRKFDVNFSYNRIFEGSNDETNYPSKGSWTRRMRPDYTLSLWPSGISEDEAEKQELIVHIHFDAKYRIERILESLGDVKDLDIEKEEQSKGTYKRADLLKMHAYKDAIRRTAGAYILYPGNEKETYKRTGFREIIPGLGAFQIRPSENNDNGSADLINFIEDVVYHFGNRTSQREKTAFRIYDIHKDEPKVEDEFRASIPENLGVNRGLIPDETFVLIGFFKSEEHFNWIKKRKLYNFRTGSGKDSLILDKKTIGAKYLLLHTHGDKTSSEIWKIKQAPKVFSLKDLQKMDYPDGSGDYYLVIEIEEIKDTELQYCQFEFKKLANYHSNRGSGLPFIASLAELMRTKIKSNSSKQIGMGTSTD